MSNLLNVCLIFRQWLAFDCWSCWYTSGSEGAVVKDEGAQCHGAGDEGMGGQSRCHSQNAAQTLVFTTDEVCHVGKNDFRFLWCWLIKTVI